MRTTRNSFNFELLEGATFEGKFDIPIILGTQIIPDKIIPFDKALQEKKPEDKFVHFYINDFQFDRIWNKPNKYIKILKKFAGVISPDFSMFIDMPNTTNIFAHYKRMVLSHFYQQNGITVIPSFSSAGEKSYEWCFDGLPKNSVIFVSSVGVEKIPFIESIYLMNKKLQPSKILMYGKVFNEFNQEIKNKIVKYESRVEQLQKINKGVKMYGWYKVLR